MMRLLKGTLKGKRLPQHDAWVRPTSAFRREMIFNRLAHAAGFKPLADCHVLDLFAGTGALGLEAFSRGAAHVTLVEKDPFTHKKLRQFLTAHHLEKAVDLLLADACHLPPLPPLSVKADLCFLDAPYHKNLIPQALDSLHQKGWLAPKAHLIAEIDHKEDCHLPNWITLTHERQKGRTRVLFLQKT